MSGCQRYPSLTPRVVMVGPSVLPLNTDAPDQLRAAIATRLKTETNPWKEPNAGNYQAKCANALFASAMRWVFSRLVIAAPSLR